MAVLVVAVAMAIEPSNTIVTIDGKSYYKHTVESGQTLYALSKAYNVTETQIVECNEGLSAETLKAGSVILIPRVEQPTGVKGKISGSGSTSKTGKGDAKFITYEVKAGDTIYSVARKYKISVEVLEKDNPSIDIEHISPGMKLRIRRSESGSVTTEDIERERRKRAEETELKDGEHRVQAGETVYSLSRSYGMTEEEFLELNGLKSAAELKAGMVVRTKPQAAEQSTPANSTTPATPSAPATAATPERAEYHGVDTVVDSAVAAVSEDDVAEASASSGNAFYMDDAMLNDVYVQPLDVAFPPLSMHHTLKVALMLPFHYNNKVNPYFVDLYRGVLIAMEDLKAEGYNIELSVFDTCGDGNRISDIVSYESGLLEAQLIIGPVYEAEFRYVLGYAEENGIPVVSPLADIEKLQSPVLFQMPAEDDNKYDKMADIFDGSREIVTIYAGNTDKGFASEIRSRSAQSPTRDLNFVFNRESFFYRRNVDGSNGEKIDISALMRTKNEKAFVVVAANETDVDRILTTLSSTKSSIEGRGMTYGSYVVIGNRKWLQSDNIDRQSFFRNNAIFVVPYHAKRSSDSVRLFDGRYVKAYGVLPSMYSYRGYDAAMIFCRKMFTGIDGSMLTETFTPLATSYNFDLVGGLYVNTRWVREDYKSNFTIEVK